MKRVLFVLTALVLISPEWLTAQYFNPVTGQTRMMPAPHPVTGQTWLFTPYVPSVRTVSTTTVGNGQFSWSQSTVTTTGAHTSVNTIGGSTEPSRPVYSAPTLIITTPPRPTFTYRPPPPPIKPMPPRSTKVIVLQPFSKDRLQELLKPLPPYKARKLELGPIVITSMPPRK